MFLSATEDEKYSTFLVDIVLVFTFCTKDLNQEKLSLKANSMCHSSLDSFNLWGWLRYLN